MNQECRSITNIKLKPQDIPRWYSYTLQGAWSIAPQPFPSFKPSSPSLKRTWLIASPFFSLFLALFFFFSISPCSFALIIIQAFVFFSFLFLEWWEQKRKVDWNLKIGVKYYWPNFPFYPFYKRYTNYWLERLIRVSIS